MSGGGVTIENTDSRQETVTLTVPSHPRFLYVIRSALYPLIIDAGFRKRDAAKMVLAVDEACSNIIRHAYGGQDDHPITLTVEFPEDRFLIRLRDYGKKADPSEIAPRDLADVRPGGLGTFFIKAVFDDVQYDTSVDRGTLLTMAKTKPQVSQ